MGTACRGKNPKHPSCKEKGNLLFCVLYAFSTYLYCNNNILQVFGIRAIFYDYLEFLLLMFVYWTMCMYSVIRKYTCDVNSVTTIIHVSFFWMLLFMLALELHVLHSDILHGSSLASLCFADPKFTILHTFMFHVVSNMEI